MTVDTLAEWHKIVTTRSASALDSLLADDVVFHSPVVYTPQVGKAITGRYLTAAFHVFFNPSFRYSRECREANGAILEFEVDIDGIHVNGVDMIRWHADGKINEFKVMIRPLKAVHLIQEKMAAILAKHQ